VDFELAFKRLTGRHVLGPGVFWSTLGFGLLAHALGSGDLANGNVFQRALSVFVAHLALMTIVYLTKFLTRPLKAGPLSVILVVIGYVVAGAVRGLTLQFALFSFQVADTGFSIYRLVGGVVVMATGLAWTSLAFGLKAEWGAKRAALQATKDQLETLLIDSEARLEHEASDTLSTIESMLQTALIPELMLTPQRVLIRLQSLINDTLRPLSATLASSLPKIELVRLDPQAYRFRWRTLITHLRLKESSRPITTGLVLSVLALNGFVKYIPQINPFFLLLMSFTLIVSALTFTRFVLSRWVDRLTTALRVPLVALLLFGLGFLGGLAVLSFAKDQMVILPLAINGAVSMLLVGSLFGINHAASREMRSIEQQLNNHEDKLRWTIAALNGQHWLQKKQFARKIHGPIQSEVAAAAIRIERSLTRGEVTESGEAALQTLRDRLDKILKDDRAVSEVRPVLDEISETWHGLCEIDFELADDLECNLREDPICVETVLEIAREACSNAIRHGSAEHIRLEISFSTPDLVKIVVQNDGTKLDLGSNRGIGSAYLDDCTFSHDLTMTEAGTVLTATVPFRSK
jgi:signal transduction histidine kinase